MGLSGIDEDFLFRNSKRWHFPWSNLVKHFGGLTYILIGVFRSSFMSVKSYRVIDLKKSRNFPVQHHIWKVEHFWVSAHREEVFSFDRINSAFGGKQEEPSCRRAPVLRVESEGFPGSLDCLSSLRWRSASWLNSNHSTSVKTLHNNQVQGNHTSGGKRKRKMKTWVKPPSSIPNPHL